MVLGPIFMVCALKSRFSLCPKITSFSMYILSYFRLKTAFGINNNNNNNNNKNDLILNSTPENRS